MFLTSIKTKTCGIAKQQMKCVYIETKERDRGGERREGMGNREGKRERDRYLLRNRREKY